MRPVFCVLLFGGLGGCTCATPPMVDLDASVLLRDGGSADASVAESDAGDQPDSSVADAGSIPDAGPLLMTDAGPSPYVEIRGDALRIEGQPVFLYGGDLHYFRVRAANNDVATTHAMWANSMDRMRDAGMNLVSTYIPWDYHELSEGHFNFTGIRDVSLFLHMACDRGFKVIVKPGPLITGEWPGGFGTFGAVPEWWKVAHPEALARKSDGSLYSYSPTGASSQRQPTLLHPTYLSSVAAWYDRVLPLLTPFKNRCLVALQIDNETNFFWSSRFGDTDYSATSLAHWRTWLATRYGTISQLNQAYGTSHASFSVVPAPDSVPGSNPSERPKNRWAADWYEGGLAFIGDYLAQLKQMMVSRGFNTPDVLFLTNDSPFPLIGPSNVLVKQAITHDGPTKNAIGLCALDLYPKQLPTNSALADQPFQPDYFTRLYDFFGDIATGPQEFTFAAELQGGFYAYPLLGQPNVRPALTDQLMSRTVGRGLKGGVFYVIRDGLNADNSQYDYDAALALDGTPTPRFAVMAKWGRLLQAHGQALLTAREVTDSVVLLADRRHAAPQGGLLDNMPRLAGIEYPAVFGWLANAGFNPVVMEVSRITVADLSPFRAVIYLNPDFQDDAVATTLADYVQGGGTLVNFLWPGRNNDRFQPSTASNRYAALFPLSDQGSFSWTNANRTGAMNGRWGTYDGRVTSNWYASFWRPASGTTPSPFLWERQVTGNDGDLIGYALNTSVGKRVFIGTSVASPFNQSDYYSLALDELNTLRSLARHTLSYAGVAPKLSADGTREVVWARRAGQELFLFIINDNDVARSVHLSFTELSAFGLNASTTYTVSDVLAQVPLPAKSGAQVLSQGLTVSVSPFGTAVVRLEPR
jgi:hypothetical protein